MEKAEKQFIITKKVAKHGKQAVILVPKVLENQLKPGTLMRITIDILEQTKEVEDGNVN